MIGKELVFRYVNGKTVVSVRPDFSKVKWTKKQRKHRNRFKRAAAEAKAMAAKPEVREKYKSELKPGYTVYNLILKELMKKE